MTQTQRVERLSHAQRERLAYIDFPKRPVAIRYHSMSSVDCSPDHRLKEEQYRLALSDPLALYGVENARLAPGYRLPDVQTER